MKLLKKMSLGAIFVFMLMLLPVNISGAAGKGIDWNDKSINWKDYNVGMEAGRRNNKPVLLLFYADW